MATEQPGSPKRREDVGGDERRSKVKTPSKSGEHSPGMGEDQDEDYVPEKRPSQFPPSMAPRRRLSVRVYRVARPALPQEA